MIHSCVCGLHFTAHSAAVDIANIFTGCAAARRALSWRTRRENSAPYPIQKYADWRYFMLARRAGRQLAPIRPAPMRPSEAPKSVLHRLMGGTFDWRYHARVVISLPLITARDAQLRSYK